MTFAEPLPVPWKTPPRAAYDTPDGITNPSRRGSQGRTAPVQGRAKLPCGRLDESSRVTVLAEASFPAVTLTVMRARQKMRWARDIRSCAKAGKRAGKFCSSSVSHRRKVMPDACSWTAPSAVEQARTLDMAALCPAVTICSAIAARRWRRKVSACWEFSHCCPTKSSVRRDRAFSSFASRILQETHRNVRQRSGAFCRPYASTVNQIFPNRERISRLRSARLYLAVSRQPNNWAIKDALASSSGDKSSSAK